MDRIEKNTEGLTSTEQAIDPVCGMRVNISTAKWFHEYAGRKFYFCGSRCLEKFKADPDQYAARGDVAPASTKLSQAATSATSTGEYTCPMHPEIRQNHPGSCPKCGMALESVAPPAPVSTTEYVCPMHPQIVRPTPGNCPICGMTLEPRVVSADEQASPELADMTRRFWISTALAIPLVLIDMSRMIAGQPVERVIPASLGPWIELALASPIVLWAGAPLFVRGWHSIVNRSLNMFTLIAMGIGVAYSYSL